MEAVADCLLILGSKTRAAWFEVARYRLEVSPCSGKGFKLLDYAKE